MRQIRQLAGIFDRLPLVMSPYDAELFGHWWYEGPEFLDCFVRKAATTRMCSGSSRRRISEKASHASDCETGPSSWGEEGYWRVWLNETNQWIYPHLHVAQERMTRLARRFRRPTPLQQRALRQAARELLLARRATGRSFSARHQPGLRAQTREGPFAPLHRPARSTHEFRRG